MGGAGRDQDRPGPARLVHRSGDRAPLRSWPLQLPDRPSLAAADRQHQAGLGDLPAAASHAAGHGLVPDPRGGVRGPGGEPAPLLVAGESLPVGRALDQRHRTRHPADQPGLDPPPSRRLARRGWPVRGGSPGGPADPVAPAVSGRVPEPGLVGQQPRHRRGCRAARGQLRVPVVSGKRAVAAHLRRAARARAGPQHLPVGHRPRARRGLPVLRRRARVPGGGRGRRQRSPGEHGDVGAAGRAGGQRGGPDGRAIAAAAPGRLRRRPRAAARRSGAQPLAGGTRAGRGAHRPSRLVAAVAGRSREHARGRAGARPPRHPGPARAAAVPLR